jgi:hypothetical protein
MKIISYQTSVLKLGVIFNAKRKEILRLIMKQLYSALCLYYMIAILRQSLERIKCQVEL